MNDSPDNVVPIRRDEGPPSGSGSDLRERVARLENEIVHLATKTDVQKIKIWILSGVIGGIVAGISIVLMTATTILRLISEFQQ